MRRSNLVFVVVVLMFFSIITAVDGYNVFSQQPPPPPEHGLLGMPPVMFFAPGDSVEVPLEVFEPVPADSQVSGVAMTIRKSSSDFAFLGAIDTTATVLQDWSFAVTTGADSLRIEATAPAGVFLEHAEGPPARLFDFRGNIAPAALEGDSMKLWLESVSFISRGNEVAFADSEFQALTVFIGEPGEHEDGLFAISDTAAHPGETVPLQFLALQPLPADSQLSRIKFVVHALPPDFSWDVNAVSLAPALAGWTLNTNGAADSLQVEVTAPTNTFLVHDGFSDLHLLTLVGTVAQTAPTNHFMEIVVGHLAVTVHGVDVTVDPQAIKGGGVFVIGDPGPSPPPPGGQHALLGFPPHLNFPPGADAFLPLLFFGPVPADSMINGFSFTAFANSPLFTFDPVVDTLQSALRGWDILVTGDADSVDFEATAPAGLFFVHEDGPPAKLALLKGFIVPEAPLGDSIEIGLRNIFVSRNGVALPVPDSLVQHGRIFIGDGGPPPDGGPGDDHTLFAFLETGSHPDSSFALEFAVMQPVPVDSQVSRIRAVIKVLPPYLNWDNNGHVLSAALSSWSFVSTADTDSMTFDLQAPAGEYLSHHDDDPFVLVTFVGEVDGSAPVNGEVLVLPEKLFVTHGGIEELLPPKAVGPGRIFLGMGGIHPPLPPIPPLATTEGRTNLGLYGGTVMDMAFDTAHGLMFAAVAAPQSVFASADSGLTWYAAFPSDSLEFLTNFQTRGFGGRALQVEASDGYCYARTSQEAGTLTGSQVSTDGVNWRTLLDGYSAENELRAAFGGSVQGPYAIGALSSSGATALVSAGNFVFRTTDAGSNWDITVVPDPSSMSSHRQVESLELRRSDASGQSFYVSMSESFDRPGEEFYRTSDGTNFTRLYVASGPDTAHIVSAIASHPSASDSLWVSAFDPANPGVNGLWRSYDAGDTWTKVFATGNPFMVPSATIYEDASYPGPGNIRLFLVGEDRYSDDLGDTWTSFSPQNDPYYPRVSAANVGIGHIPGTDIYFSQGDGSPARSTSGLNSEFMFVPTGIEGVTIWDIAQVPNEMDKVYLATSVGVAYTSVFTDTSITTTAKWLPPYGNYPVNPSGGGNMGFTAIAIDPDDTNHIVAANGNGIFVSETGGFNNDAWNSASYSHVSGLDEPTFKGRGGRVSQITFISSDSVIASAYTEHELYGALLLSVDGGATWSTMPQAGNHMFKSVIAAWNTAQDSLVLFAAGGGVAEDPVTHSVVIDSGAVYKSLDGGATWSRPSLAPHGTFNPAPFPLPVNEIMAKPGSLDTLYLACGENLSNAIVRTFDGGHTLESISMQAIGAREGAFEAVAINKNHPDSIYFAVRRDILVYDAVSDLATTLFRGYPGELTHTLLYDDLTMGSSSGFYQVKSSGSVPTGVSDKPKTLPNRIELLQNYPNPFNPSTRIVLKLPQDGRAKLVVYNILGQRVAELLSDQLTAGRHEVLWQPRNLASGVYIYRLTVAFAPGREQVLSKKLMYLK